MIVSLAVLVLAAVSVHVRRLLNEVAMLLVCTIVWMFVWVAIPLESPRRMWRIAGLGALGLVLVTCWKAGELVVRVIRHLP